MQTAGFEPATSTFVVPCSIQLSYACVKRCTQDSSLRSLSTQLFSRQLPRHPDMQQYIFQRSAPFSFFLHTKASFHKNFFPILTDASVSVMPIHRLQRVLILFSHNTFLVIITKFFYCRISTIQLKIFP